MIMELWDYVILGLSIGAGKCCQCENVAIANSDFQFYSPAFSTLLYGLTLPR